ncbi:MAG: hypothetical protein ACFCD0_05745 [Gemmataceae bacterium]
MATARPAPKRPIEPDPTVGPTRPTTPTHGEPIRWIEQARLLQNLIPQEQLHRIAPHAQQTFFTPTLVIHLMLYQRLNDNAPLELALSQLKLHFPKELLPDCKKTREDNISDNTGGYSKARNKLALGVYEYVAKHS